MTGVSDRSRWGFLFAEAVLIVLSILLAFAIDAWWDGRQEDARRLDLLAAMRDDFEATSLVLDSAIVEADADARRTGTFLIIVADGLDVPRDSLAWLFEGVAEIVFFEPSIASYRTAVSTGSLELVRNAALVTALTEFDRQLEVYDLHLSVSADLFYLEAVQDLRRGTGGFLAPVVPVGPDGRSILPDDFDFRGPLAVSTVEPVYFVHWNILDNLRAMRDAATRIVAELNRALKP